MSETQVEAITYKYGDTYPINLKLSNNVTGADTNITGNTFTLYVYPSQSAVLADLVFQVAGTITSATEGELQFPITTTESNNEGDFFYEVKMNDGSLQTILEGPFTINKKIFRR